MPKSDNNSGGQVVANSSRSEPNLVIITGTSGSGKLTALKAFEDLGFYAVDNLPVTLVPKFADLTLDSKSQRRSALTIDIREGDQLKLFPKIYADLKRRGDATIVFFDALVDTRPKRV